MYFLMSDYGRTLLSPQQGGGTYNISASTFQEVKINVPPLDIQNQIVARLDGSLRTLDDIRKLSEVSKFSIKSIINAIWEH